MRAKKLLTVSYLSQGEQLKVLESYNMEGKPPKRGDLYPYGESKAGIKKDIRGKEMA